MIRAGPITALLAAAAALAGCAAPAVDKAGGATAAKPVVLTLANPFSGPEEVQGFAAEVGRLSGGTLRINIETRWRNGQTDFENATIGDVRAGKADLGVVGSRAWDSVGVTSFRALSAPLLIDSYPLQEKVLTSPLPARMLVGLAPLGLMGLGVLPGPLRYPVAAPHPLLGPTSYAGLRIGVQQSLLASATFRALGATPVWLPALGPVTGLDGVEQSIGNVANRVYDPVRRYLTGNVVLWPRPLVIFASGKAFAKLTAAQQRILREAVTKDVTAETASVRSNELTATADLCRSQQVRFVTATSADRAALRRAVQPVYDQLERDPVTRRQIAQIVAMRANASSEPAPHCPPVSVSGAGAGPLDGIYQYTVTYADLEAAHPVSGELVPENIGKFTFVLDRGHFATTTENAQACVWGYGTFTVRGDIIRMLFANGGGMAPTGAENTPGELATMQWSLYRDELTMRRVRIPNTGAPTPFIAKPWRQVSTTPSAQFLSKRCPPPANALGR